MVFGGSFFDKDYFFFENVFRGKMVKGMVLLFGRHMYLLRSVKAVMFELYHGKHK